MKTHPWTFAAVTLTAIVPSACGGHHANLPAQPYVDRSIWVEPTTGCSDASPKALPKFRVSDTLTRPKNKSEVQELTAWLARRVPGGLAFGRAFDDKHQPIIRLTDTTQKLAALTTLDSLAPPSGRPRALSADSVRAEQVRWDYAELYDWTQYLQSGFGHPALGVNGLGIDTHNDRIEFGVAKRESIQPLVNWLIERGVPCRLVVVRVIGPIRLLGLVSRASRRLTIVAADERSL